MLKRGLFSCAVLGIATSAFAGLRFELRPGVNLADVTPGVTYNAEVYVVEDAIHSEPVRQFRGVQLNFAASHDVNAQVMGAPTFFDWDYLNNIGLGSEFFTYPTTTWIWPIGTPNMFMITLGEQVAPDPDVLDVAKVGDFQWSATNGNFSLDIANPGETNPNFQSFLTYGFGQEPNDPVVLIGNGQYTYGWRTPNGATDNGPFQVPEPATLGLLAVGAIAAIRRRRSA